MYTSMYFFLIIIYKSKMYYRSEPEEWDSRLKSTLLFLGYRHICPDHIGIMWFRIIDLKKTVFMWKLFYSYHLFHRDLLSRSSQGQGQVGLKLGGDQNQSRAVSWCFRLVGCFSTQHWHWGPSNTVPPEIFKSMQHSLRYHC